MGRIERIAAAATVAGTLALLLSGCVGGAAGSPNTLKPAPPATATAAPSGEPSATSTPTASADPTYVIGGTAEQNRPIFDLTNQRYFTQAGNVIPEGRGVIDNLVSAGFDKAKMQITPDRTAIDLPVDSLVFSVLEGKQCLIGQFSAVGYSTIIAPKLSTGECLVGLTRTIDW